MKEIKLYIPKGCLKCGSCKLDGGLPWIDGINRLCDKCSREDDGFLGSPRAAELLFGPAVRKFIKRLEKLIEKKD